MAPALGPLVPAFLIADKPAIGAACLPRAGVRRSGKQMASLRLIGVTTSVETLIQARWLAHEKTTTARGHSRAQNRMMPSQPASSHRRDDGSSRHDYQCRDALFVTPPLFCRLVRRDRILPQRIQLGLNTRKALVDSCEAENNRRKHETGKTKQ